MKLEHLTVYGRVKPVALRRDLQVNGKRYAHLVTVTWTLWGWKPIWSYGQHMEIVTPNETYKVYNPQALAFEINQLMSVIRTYMKTIETEIISERIVK